MQQQSLEMQLQFNPIPGGQPLRPPFRFFFVCPSQATQDIQLIFGDYS